MPAFRADPGFLAVSYGRRGVPISRLEQVVDVIHGDPASCSSSDHDFLATWGLPTSADGGRRALLLVRGARLADDDLSVEQAATLLFERRAELANVLPPFGVVGVDESSTVAATDAMGSRHLYHTSGGGWAAISTSCKALSLLAGSGIDREAVAVQSLLGWQLGLRTLQARVAKLDAGSLMTLRQGRVDVAQYDPAAAIPGRERSTRRYARAQTSCTNTSARTSRIIRTPSCSSPGGRTLASF